MPTADRPPPRHFSMIRGFHLADLFTLGNAACGVASVLMALTYVASRSTHQLLAARQTTAQHPTALIGHRHRLELTPPQQNR